MAEYIEREAVKKLICGFCNDCDGGADVCQYRDIQVDAIPAADVRPVVYCKDCMYAPSRTDGGGGRGFALEWPYNEWPESNPCPCRCDDGWYSREPNPDFFCANGKREER